MTETATPQLPSLVYGGAATVFFDPADHSYRIEFGGRSYNHPSVTTILKALGGKTDILMDWAANQAIDSLLAAVAPLPPGSLDYTGLVSKAERARLAWVGTRDEAGVIGKHVHSILENEILGRRWSYPDVTADTRQKIAHAVEAGMKFFAEHRIQVIETEGVRWSPTHGFVGTGDVIARMDDKLVVLDYKTGKSASYPAYFAQTAAYAMAYEEEHPDKTIEERWIVRVGKFGGLDTAVRKAKHHAADRAAFLQVLGLWRWLETFHRNGYDGPVLGFGWTGPVLAPVPA